MEHITQEEFEKAQRNVDQYNRMKIVVNITNNLKNKKDNGK